MLGIADSNDDHRKFGIFEFEIEFMSNLTKQSFISSLIFGSLFILVGTFVFLMSIDVIHVPDEDFNAPRWAVAAVGMAFALAGAMVALKGLKSGFGDHIIFKWIYNAMLLMFMILFAVPFHWVAFGSGERSFNGSTSVGTGSISVIRSGGGESSGRLVFGIGAILMDVFILFILYRIFEGKNLSKGE